MLIDMALSEPLDMALNEALVVGLTEYEPVESVEPIVVGFLEAETV